jgi:hypothetical protein
MFVQVIEARVQDAAGLRRQVEDWEQHLAAGATGWLGTTAGITEDGRFVLAARFASPEAARANSDRPEQGQWWAATEKMLDEVHFVESSDITSMGEGSDDAGFVQFMHGRMLDRSRLETLNAELNDRLTEVRSDILGGYELALSGDGFVAVTYFTSEAEARAGESQEPPADLAESLGEWQALMVDVEWFDLPDPWLASPA